MTTIPKAELLRLVNAAFSHVGIDHNASTTIFNHLLHNEMAGKKSHGFLRVKWSIDYIKKNGTPTNMPKLAIDFGGLAIVDGGNNLGLIAAQYAADIAIKKAKKHGISFIGVRNHFGTTGTMHYYNSMFVKDGLVGIAGCNSLAHVCHPHGIDPVIGTNPISFGIPSAKTPCIIDVTTAQWAYGKLLEIYKSGKDMPNDAMIDHNGNPSQNIKDASDGAILPMNGIKGFSIGLAIEILSGALIGAKMGKDAVGGSDGLFFITINPDALVGQKKFEENVEKLLQEIKQSRHHAEITEILIPGERSEKNLKQEHDKEAIDIIDNVYNDIKELAHG